MLKFYRFEFRRNLKRYNNNLTDLTYNFSENMMEEVYEAVLKLNTDKKEEEVQGTILNS